MTLENMQSIFENKRESLHGYLYNIKKNMAVDIYSIINTTLINNYNITNFPKNFFLAKLDHKNRTYAFLKNCLKFYLKQCYLFTSYFISFLIFKIYYKKDKVVLKNHLAIDVFFMVNSIIRDNKFNENYFTGLYDVLEKHNQKYVFLPRLYGVNKNPFKLISFLKIINQDDRNFLFEYEFLSFKDFLCIFIMIMLYPFKTLRLIQKENSQKDVLFNNELIQDISHLSFDAFTRYVFGKKISNLSNIAKIYSWSEFQVIERSFNYGIRTNNKNIKLYGCQLYINYPLLNSYVDDIDFEHLTSPHNILVNGRAYLLDRENVKYHLGISLRYRHLFENTIEYFSKKSLNDRNILLLISYFTNELNNLIEFTKPLNNNIIFKTHPANNQNVSQLLLSLNYQETKQNIYEIFPFVDIVISGSTGSTLEAVACGKSVIIITDQENPVGNPLSAYGKGKIWDIAFTSDDVKKMYNNLIKYRNENADEIQKIAVWYKENFFIEPTEENIVKAFELDKE